MTDKRGFYGGIALAIAGLPLLLSYRLSPIGIVGLGLIIVGTAIAYGARQVY